MLSVLAVLFLVGTIMLIPLGLRAGDRSDDALLVNVELRITPRGAAVTVTNPGRDSVMLGLSLRRPGLRLRLEGRSYVRLRTGSMSSDLRAGQPDRLRTIHRLVVVPQRELGGNDPRHQVRKPGLEPLER